MSIQAEDRREVSVRSCSYRWAPEFEYLPETLNIKQLCLVGRLIRRRPSATSLLRTANTQACYACVTIDDV